MIQCGFCIYNYDYEQPLGGVEAVGINETIKKKTEIM